LTAGRIQARHEIGGHLQRNTELPANRSGPMARE